MQLRYGSAPRSRPTERAAQPSSPSQLHRRKSYPATWECKPSSNAPTQHYMESRRSSSVGPARPSAQLVHNRYKIDCIVGKGHFASVYKAVDLSTGSCVALKVLGPEYKEDARIEQVILQRINEADRKGRKKVVKLISAFTWQDSFCFIMPLLGDALSGRKLGVHDGKVPRESLQLLAKQMADALTFLHGKCALVHTDLKPDNILLDDNTHRGIGRGWTIADFGNAFFHIEGKDGTSLITTRPYRSPEVITRRGWRHPTDMWSLGCILYEVYMGRPLFGINNGDQQHIALITSKLGAVPGVAYNGTLKPPAKTTYLKMRFGVDDPEFLDLLTGLLEFEPTRRLRAKEMCKHPFCNPGDPTALPYDAESLRAAQRATTRHPSRDVRCGSSSLAHSLFPKQMNSDLYALTAAG